MESREAACKRCAELEATQKKLINALDQFNRWRDSVMRIACSMSGKEKVFYECKYDILF